MRRIKKIWPWFFLAFILVFILLFTIHTHIKTWSNSTEHEDISYLYLDGYRVLFGENPYARILDSNMLDNDKYTTYLPGFIELAFITERYYFREYPVWLALWRVIFLICDLSIMGLLFVWGKSSGSAVIGIFAALFWAFNRWTLYIVQVSHMDFIPILFLLISLYLLPKRRWIALAFFGLSLAFKQMAIFLLPLFLIEAYCHSTQNRLRQVLLSGLTIASVPLLSSIPFLIWNWKGFVLSILFSATRSPYQNLPEANSIDMLLGLNGLPGRIPMLIMLFLVYLAAWQFRDRFNMMLFCTLIMAVFISFNPILFNQYMPWFLLFLPLTAMELVKGQTPPSLMGLPRTD